MNIYLKKNQERRILAGHLWVFSNEIASIEGDIINGGICDVYNSQKRFIARGYYNKNSLISIRILSYRREDINIDFIRKRILKSNRRREILHKSQNAYRIVNGESDYLPGLIIDYYNGDFTFQIFSLGMENFKNDIIEILKNDLNANTIISKNKFSTRGLENLEQTEGIVFSRDDYSGSNFEIDNIKYKANLLLGQKTGFYLDQNTNRLRVREYINDSSKVLDLFCNDGGFSLNSAYASANKIIGVDSSSNAISNAKNNAKLNNFNNIEFIESDVFDYLKSNQEEKFDVIILDPPSFTKSKKSVDAAVKGYIDLNSNSMKLLNPNGILFTFSCSHHISEDEFINTLRKSVNNSNRKFQIIFTSHCSLDHPILSAMPETIYLKSVVMRRI